MLTDQIFVYTRYLCLHTVTEFRKISDHSVFTYPNEVTVELRGETNDGEFAAITYHLEPAEQDTNRVRPRDPIDRNHAEPIREALTNAGYKLIEF